MSPESIHPRREAHGLRDEAQIIVEVEGYDGELGSILVENTLARGEPPRIYCIGTIGDDGVLRFNDWGYATVEDARDALRASKAPH